MRTKKYLKKKQAHYTKRRRTGGGWFGNLFKSKQKMEAERARAVEAQQRQVEQMRREKNIAERNIAVTAEKNIVEKDWQKEKIEGWETAEELRNKIKRIPNEELAQRTSNQSAINSFLQKEITTLQNNLGTCYPNGSSVIQQARLIDVQDELYNLKEREKKLRVERNELNQMYKTTPQCKAQAKLAKEKYKPALSGEEEEDLALPVSVSEEPVEIVSEAEETVQPIAEPELEADEDFILMPDSIEDTASVCNMTYNDPDELLVDKVFNVIKKNIKTYIENGTCQDIYLKPEKFYNLVQTEMINLKLGITSSNSFMNNFKRKCIETFLNNYPNFKKIKQIIIITLTGKDLFKSLCESVSDTSTFDDQAFEQQAEKFTQMLFITLIDNMNKEYTNDSTNNPAKRLDKAFNNYFNNKLFTENANMGGKRRNRKSKRKSKSKQIRKSKSKKINKTRRHRPKLLSMK